MPSKTWKISMLLPALLLAPVVLAQESTSPEFVVGSLPSAEERLAQQNNLQIRHFILEHGLSHNQVCSILQDARGFMWFGTSSGLNRFDGYEFRTYLHDQREPRSLSHNSVTSVIQDRNGVLWVATRDGLNKFDPATETFEVFRHRHSLSKQWDQLNVIYEDRAGTIWVGSLGGLSRFDPAGANFTPFPQPPKESDDLLKDTINSIFEDSEGILWIGTPLRGVLQFDRDSATFTQVAAVDPKGCSVGIVTAIYEDRAKNLWICNADYGLSLFDRERKTITHFPYEHSLYPSDEMGMYDVVEDRSGRLWLASLSLLQFDRANRTFVEVGGNAEERGTPLLGEVLKLYPDKEGALWLGTTEGVYRLKRTAKIFKEIPTTNPVLRLWEDPNRDLWVGTAKGLSRYDEHLRLLGHFQHDPGDSGSLMKGETYAILRDHLGTLWVSTGAGGISRFDTRTQTFEHFRSEANNPHSLSNDWARVLLEDRSGTIWVGTDEGLSYFHRESDTFRRYFHPSREFASMRNNYIYCMCEGQDGDLWIGTTGGLYRLNQTGKTFRAYLHDGTDPTRLSNNSVTAILQDHSGAIWIGTYGGGLNKYIEETDSFAHFKEEDGLAHNAVCGILEDNQGRLWISTGNGLSRLDPQTASFKNYDESDGLAGNTFLRQACHRGGTSGRLFFSGMHGLTLFHPDSIRDNPYAPSVVITHFEQLNPDISVDRMIEVEGISEQKEVRLSHNTRLFTVKFAALSYENSAKNRYAYKIEGIHDRWINLGTKREVTFTGLGPGDYSLRVKGSNNDGVWNEAGTSLKITITPPWWRTWWAYTLFGLMVLGILYGLRRYEMNRQQLKHNLELEHAQAEGLQQLDHLKSRFFANISHEFRTPLTLILGPLENLRAGRFKGDLDKQYGMMERNARRLLRLINQLLDLSKLEAGKLTLQASYGNLLPFIKGIVYSFESLAERKQITLRFAAEAKEIMLYFDRDKMEKIVTNLVSNAFKFTPEGGKVSVQLSVVTHQSSVISDQFSVVSNQLSVSKQHDQLINDHWLLINVTDTGVGISAEKLPHVFERFYQARDSYTKDQPGSGIGLALTKELVELHRGEISVVSTVGRGTTFTIRLPLGKDHLQKDEIVESGVSDLAGGKLQKASEREAVDPLIQESIDPSIQHLASSNQHQATSDQIILIVEDNPDMRAYIREQLSDMFRVVEAEDGEEGFEKSVDKIPDLIISDVMMPKMDGYQLGEKLKTDERTSHVPVILLTAKSSGESKLEGLELGADDYLIKPFDSRELQVRVKNLIDQRRKLRERFGKEVKLQPRDIAITSTDEQFLERAMAVVDEHISKADFDVETFGRKVGMSRKHLHRKLKALTDQAPSEFIRTLRLQRAAQLLEKNAGNVTEVAYEVGFNSISHFAKAFKEQFGILPSEYPNEL